MDEKPKHHPLTRLLLTWNLATFARRFDAELDAAPETVADLLRAADGQVRVVGVNRYTQYVTVTPDDDQSFAFELRLLRDTSPWLMPTVRAEGRILHSQGYQRTILTGEMRLGALATLGLLGTLLLVVIGGVGALLSGGVSSDSLAAVPVVILALAMVGMTYAQGYLSVQAILEQTLRRAAALPPEEQAGQTDGESDTAAQQLRR